MWYVYQLYNTLNGKIYIGKSSDKRSRVIEHICISKGGKEKYGSTYSLVHKAIKKYGNAIEFKIIQYFSLEVEAFQAEKYWIEFFKSNVSKYGNEFGYNLTDGGEGVSGYKHTEESKSIMKEKSPRGETHRLYGNSSWGNHDWKGDKNPNFGKTASPETRIKMSITRKGRLVRFSQELVSQIYQEYLNGQSMISLATKYQCSRMTISKIVKRNKS